MSDYGRLQDDADAFLALLRAVPDLTVYPPEEGGPTTVPPGTEPPYVSVHFVADRPPGGRLNLKSIRLRTRVYCHCVGADDIAARVVSDLVAAAVLDVRPDIAGRNCAPIRSDIGRDPRPDESTGTTVVTITDVYRMESEPGSSGS